MVLFDRETARVLKMWREESWGAKTGRVFLVKALPRHALSRTRIQGSSDPRHPGLREA